MRKKDKKRKREAAIIAEIARREKDRCERSPLSRDDMLNLLDYVGEELMVEGRSHDFTYTLQWLNSNGFDKDKTLQFFAEEKIQDDWSLCTEGDPYSLFGPSETRLSWMPIDQPQLESLIEWLDDEVINKGCDHDLTLTKKWLKANNCPVHSTLMALIAHGGGCDCEVVLNVEPKGNLPINKGSAQPLVCVGPLGNATPQPCR
jgi:hypothetical protein